MVHQTCVNEHLNFTKIAIAVLFPGDVDRLWGIVDVSKVVLPQRSKSHPLLTNCVCCRQNRHKSLATVASLAITLRVQPVVSCNKIIPKKCE